MPATIEKQSVLDKINSIPMVFTLGMEIDELTDEFCRVKVPHDRKYDGIFETYHGGMLMTVADTMACFIILKKFGTQIRVATTDMNIRFLAPCIGEVTAEARFIKAGRTLNPIAVDLFDSNRTKVAVAQVCYIHLK